MYGFSENQSLVVQAVAGLGAANDPYDPYFRSVSKGHDRAWFHTMAFYGKLQGKAAEIDALAKSNKRLKAGKPLGRVTIAKVADADEAVSLETLLRARHTIMMLRDFPNNDPKAKALSAFLKAQFPENEIFRVNSIYPSVRAFDAGMFTDLLEKGIINNIQAFSRQVLKGFNCSPNVKDNFFKLLKDGYEGENGGPDGVYRVTEFTVNTLWAPFCEGLDQGRFKVEKDTIFPIDWKVGPRKGQVSKALPVSLGNRLP